MQSQHQSEEGTTTHQDGFSINTVDSLPIELWCLIFSYLPPQSLLTTSAVHISILSSQLIMIMYPPDTTQRNAPHRIT